MAAITGASKWEEKGADASGSVWAVDGGAAGLSLCRRLRFFLYISRVSCRRRSQAQSIGEWVSGLRVAGEAIRKHGLVFRMGVYNGSEDKFVGPPL